MLKIVEYENKYLEDASHLLYITQLRENRTIGREQNLSHEKCRDIIIDELKKKVSSALVLLDDDKLVAYVIAIIKEDEIWGNYGWVNLGAWSIEDNYSYSLGILYKEIGKVWANHKITKHVFLVYPGQKSSIERFFELGFAKQQVHGLMMANDKFNHDLLQRNKNLIVRKASKNDQSQINGFSRKIPLFQQKSPCFAPAPEEYLKALDEGFLDLTTDEEGTLYVVEKDETIIGYQLYYPVEEASLLEPENSVELAVSAISEDARGTGAGFDLTQYAINDQVRQGKSIFVTDWRSANLLSSKFWADTGFKTTAFRIYRHIDTISES